MSVEDLLIVLEHKIRREKDARKAVAEFRQDHPLQAMTHDVLQEQLASTDDPDERADAIESLSCLDSYNAVEIDAELAEDSTRMFKKRISRHITSTRGN